MQAGEPIVGYLSTVGVVDGYVYMLNYVVKETSALKLRFTSAGVTNAQVLKVYTYEIALASDNTITGVVQYTN